MKTLAKRAARKRRPTLQNGTVPPKRARNRDVRPREYLTPKEVERLIAAAKKKGRRNGLRDATMILVAFRHGLRVSELCDLTWDQIDFSQSMMHVRRIKNGIGSVQQIGGEEMRMLRALKRADGGTRFVFMTERGAPMTPAGFRKFLSRLAIGAKFQFLVHPHMLRHNAVTSWPMTAAIHGPCSTIWGTRTSCIRYATQSFHRSGSRIFGRIDLGPS
jgi:integrase